MKVLLVGFFGEGNLGDDAIAEAIAKSTPPQFKIILTAGSLFIRSNNNFFHKIKRKSGYGFISFIKTLKKTNKVIFSGGILQDWSFDGIIFYALRIIASYTFKKIPSIWGAGIGPLNNKFSRQIASKVLNMCSPIWLRDNESIAIYNKLCCKNAQLGADWTWLHECNSDFKNTNREIMSSSCNHTRISINIRPWVSNIYFLKLIDFLVLNSSTFNNPQFYGIAARHEDIKSLYKLAKESSLLRSFIDVYYPSSYQELFNVIQKLNINLGIAMRYHIVLAFIRLGIPVIIIPYDTKVKAIVKNIRDVSKGYKNDEPTNSCYVRDEIFSLILPTSTEKYILECTNRAQIMFKSYLEYLYS